MSIDQLAALVAPPESPTEPASQERLNKVERYLKTPLPDDYVGFGNLYGTGTFADGHIRIISPCCPYYQQFLNMRLEMLTLAHDWGNLAKYNVFPNSDGLLPFGDDENGNILTWCVRGNPNNWSVVVFRHGGGLEAWDMPFSEFLVKALANKIRVAPWHEKFTTKDLDFRPV